MTYKVRCFDRKYKKRLEEDLSAYVSSRAFINLQILQKGDLALKKSTNYL